MESNIVDIHILEFILLFCISWRVFMNTGACVLATCKAGTCSSLMYGQAGAFYVLEGVKDQHQIVIHPKAYIKTVTQLSSPPL